MEKPFYLASRKGWYVHTVSARGKRSYTRLGATEDEAYEEWRRRGGGLSRDESYRFDSVADAFLHGAEHQVKLGPLAKRTVDGYGWYLARLDERWPQIKADELKPFHVTIFIQENNWGPAGVRNCVSAVKRCLNWSVEQGLLDRHQLSGMKRPASPRRKVTIADDVHQRKMESVATAKFNGRIDRAFGLVLVALKHCGGRPQDVANVQVENVDSEVSSWTMAEHKTARKTEKPRVVYLSACLQTLTKMAMHGRESGPLFRNRRGGVTVNAISNRIARLREKLGLPKGSVAYSYRHTHITEALTRGVGAATVAELTGTSIEMIQRHYGHLYANKQHLRDAANRAVVRGRAAE